MRRCENQARRWVAGLSRLGSERGVAWSAATPVYIPARVWPRPHTCPHPGPAPRSHTTPLTFRGGTDVTRRRCHVGYMAYSHASALRKSECLPKGEETPVPLGLDAARRPRRRSKAPLRRRRRRRPSKRKHLSCVSRGHHTAYVDPPPPLCLPPASSPLANPPHPFTCMPAPTCRPLPAPLNSPLRLGKPFFQPRGDREGKPHFFLNTSQNALCLKRATNCRTHERQLVQGPDTLTRHA